LLLSVWLAAGAAGASSETDYALQCRGCHGPDGAGVPGLVPSLRGVAELLATPAGRARLLAVPGVRQASLSDERLAALLVWLAAPASPPIGDVLRDVRKLRGSAAERLDVSKNVPAPPSRP
jgi:mono/diheme cytochrome c family protein